MRVVVNIDDMTYEYEWTFEEVYEFLRVHDGESFEIQIFGPGDK